MYSGSVISLQFSYIKLWWNRRWFVLVKCAILVLKYLQNVSLVGSDIRFFVLVCAWLTCKKTAFPCYLCLQPPLAMKIFPLLISFINLNATLNRCHFYFALNRGSAVSCPLQILEDTNQLEKCMSLTVWWYQSVGSDLIAQCTV